MTSTLFRSLLFFLSLINALESKRKNYYELLYQISFF